MLIALLGDDGGYDVYESEENAPCPACELVYSLRLSVVKPKHFITEVRNYLIQPTGPIELGSWLCASKPNSPEMRELWDTIVRELQKAAN
jgi:hypothetical protein